MENTIGKILFALQFAAHKHRNQRRKGADQLPYINHPIAVAELLWRVGGIQDEIILQAALLHDTVEDTDTTPEELEAAFGREVREVVMEATDDKSLPKLERKRLQVVNAPHKSVRARAVKIADKICNLVDIVNNPPSHWDAQRVREYVIWCEQVVSGLRGQYPALEQAFDEALADAKRKMELG